MGFIKIIQIFLSLCIVGLILIQSKGGGLTSSVGGAFSTYTSKRGVEKVVFISTIVMAVLLMINSLLIIVLS